MRDVLASVGIRPVFEQDGAMQVEGMAPAQIGEMAAWYRVVLHELSPQKASLEEAFMQLTAGSVEYHAHEQGPTPDGRNGQAGRRRR
jgi:ABC-2 type transport system ATP-binding protein